MICVPVVDSEGKVLGVVAYVLNLWKWHRVVASPGLTWTGPEQAETLTTPEVFMYYMYVLQPT